MAIICVLLAAGVHLIGWSFFFALVRSASAISPISPSDLAPPSRAAFRQVCRRGGFLALLSYPIMPRFSGGIDGDSDVPADGGQHAPDMPVVAEGATFTSMAKCKPAG